MQCVQSGSRPALDLSVGIHVPLVVANDVCRVILPQYREHDAQLLPFALLFGPEVWRLEQVLHLGVVDWVHFVDRQQRTRLVILRMLLRVLVKRFLIQFFYFRFLLDKGSDARLEHVLCVELRISQLLHNLEELWVLVLADLCLANRQVFLVRPVQRVEPLV